MRGNIHPWIWLLYFENCSMYQFERRYSGDNFLVLSVDSGGHEFKIRIWKAGRPENMADIRQMCYKMNMAVWMGEGRVTHICVSKLNIIGSDNGLSPGRRQAIIWTNVWILLIGPLGA